MGCPQRMLASQKKKSLNRDRTPRWNNLETKKENYNQIEQNTWIKQVVETFYLFSILA